MKTQTTLLLTGFLISGVAATTLAAPQGNLVVNTGGSMRVQLDVPTDKDVDLTTPVTMGRIELAYNPIVPGAIGHFWLNHVSVSFADFSISRRPFGNHTFRSVGVHLRDAVEFWAFESPAGVFKFTLLPEEITLYGGALVSGSFGGHKVGNEQPSEEVTGTIDLNAKTFKVKVVLKKEKSFTGISVGGPITINLVGTIGQGSGTDKDGDGVPDDKDNCVLVANPRQEPIPSPIVTAPPPARFGTCAAAHFGVLGGIDVCNGLAVDFTHDAPPRFTPGTTTVTWTGRSISGQVAEATQRVTVADATPPVFLSVPPAVTVSACAAAIDIGLAMAADDCGSGTPLVTNDAPARFTPGQTVVTWTATDGAGNRTTATQLVTMTACGARR